MEYGNTPLIREGHARLASLIAVPRLRERKANSVQTNTSAEQECIDRLILVLCQLEVSSLLLPGAGLVPNAVTFETSISYRFAACICSPEYQGRTSIIMSAAAH